MIVDIMYAKIKDLPVILDLQKLAFQSEARRLENDDIPPLRQTLEEIVQEFEQGTILKAVADGCIVGSVRGYVESGTLFIGKLMVHPDLQGRGLGTQLLQAIEERCPHERCELYASSKSEDNIRLYERHGYTRFREQAFPEGYTLVYLEK